VLLFINKTGNPSGDHVLFLFLRASFPKNSVCGDFSSRCLRSLRLVWHLLGVQPFFRRLCFLWNHDWSVQTEQFGLKIPGQVSEYMQSEYLSCHAQRNRVPVWSAYCRNSTLLGVPAASTVCACTHSRAMSDKIVQSHPGREFVSQSPALWTRGFIFSRRCVVTNASKPALHYPDPTRPSYNGVLTTEAGNPLLDCLLLPLPFFLLNR